MVTMINAVDLNEEQRAAVEHVEGPLLVLAGAGSGKTRVVTQRIAHLLELGVPSSSVLGVTFTNKAADEMKERVKKLTAASVTVCTFHSLGARILREAIDTLDYRRDFVIYDEEDSLKVVMTCLENEPAKERKARAKALRAMISRAKNDMRGPGEVEPDPAERDLGALFPLVYAQYQSLLKMCNAVDFDDLLFLTVRLFREHPDVLARFQRRWTFVSVDEFQDTNAAQYAMIQLLVARTGNLCVVGDPDQSIYSWRGADIGNIMNFARDYPATRVVRLEENYRSTNTILQAANALISHNANRYDKVLWSRRGEGDKVRVVHCGNERHEARFVVETIHTLREEQEVKLGDMAVLYRTNFQSRPFEDLLIAEGIPYVIVGGVSFYHRREIKDILAFLRVVASSADFVSFARTVNLPKRGLGDKAVAKIQAGAIAAEEPIIDYCRRLIDGTNGDGTTLTKRQREALGDYIDVIDDLRGVRMSDPLPRLVAAAYRESGYTRVLDAEPDTREDRIANLEELVSKADEWLGENSGGDLDGFLAELSLKTSWDEAGADNERLSLMTLHNSKGLEFDACFLVGMDHGLFPHINAHQTGLEEERRLCYVGMTRARRWLFMSTCSQRFMWGSSKSMRPSSFLQELPRGLIEENAPASDSVDHDELNAFAVNDIQSEFGPGDRVMHKDFGVGVIDDAYEGSPGTIYEVTFAEDPQPRALVARYAQLKRV